METLKHALYEDDTTHQGLNKSFNQEQNRKQVGSVRKHTGNRNRDIHAAKYNEQKS